MIHGAVMKLKKIEDFIITEYHETAMRLWGYGSQQRFNKASCMECSREWDYRGFHLKESAFYLETEAARLCPKELEPTRSILYLSAISMALATDRSKDAVELADEILNSNPDPGIAKQIKELVHDGSGGGGNL